MKTVATAPCANSRLVKVPGLKAKIFKRAKKSNNRITFTKFAEVFATYAGYDFKVHKTDKFAPDDKVCQYLEDPLDWYDLVDALEDNLQLALFDTNAWNKLGGSPGSDFTKPINPKLTLFTLFLFVSEQPKRPTSSPNTTKFSRRLKFTFDKETSFSDKVRYLIAGFFNFQDSWELIPDCYTIRLSLGDQSLLSGYFEDLAYDENFDFDETAFDQIFAQPCPVASDLIELLQKCYVKDIA